jgi:hypothetical protein
VSEIPIACTLDAAGLRGQAARWTRLLTSAGLSRRELAGGVALRLRADPGVEQELRALVAVERGCCAWASWQVRRDGDELVMEATSEADGVTVLHGMFAGSWQQARVGDPDGSVSALDHRSAPPDAEPRS